MFAALPRLLFTAALCAVALPAIAEEAKVVRRLGVGDTSTSIGVMPGGPDLEATGPSAMFIGQDGKLYVLDQINGRILAMDPDKPNAEPTVMPLPDALTPSDMVTVNNKLYVWDGSVHALGQAATGSPTLEARAVGDPDDVTRSTFAQMGSQTPSSDDEVINAAGRSVGTPSLDQPMRVTVQSHSLGTINVDILPRKDGKSAMVEMRSVADPLQVSRAEVKVQDKLGALEVLDITAKGDVFIFTENVPDGVDKKSATFVARYSGRGKLMALYDLPISPDQFASRRFVTVSPGGSVLYLNSDSSGVRIVDLPSRQIKGQVIAPAKVRVASVDDALPAVDTGVITAVRPNSRLGVIQMGLAFEGLKWTVSPSNYGAEPAGSCVGFADRTRRPWYIAGKTGQEVRGVPYCWGCFGSILQFKRNIEKGMVAGNICTKENPKPNFAGVDCSAFVSACWGLSRQYTTQDIPSITEELKNPWDLKPGDALNKAGSHVMLFVKFTPDRKAEVLESSTGGCNGRVCRNVYPLSVLLARGYKPVRYRALTD